MYSQCQSNLCDFGWLYDIGLAANSRDIELPTYYDLRLFNF